MASVLLENAVHGLVGDHQTHSNEMRPWPVVLAYAGLVQEALASPALAFLGWTWFPEDLPREWPHGALNADGSLAPHSRAQAFLSEFHRGRLVQSVLTGPAGVRVNAAKGGDRRIRVYGGNYSRNPVTLRIEIRGVPTVAGEAWGEVMTEQGVSPVHWQTRKVLALPPMSLFRFQF